MAQDEHDLTDPHGEAEALRKENARLRAELASGSFYKESDIDALMARAEAAEAALAASRSPDPVVNAGSCQPGDRYQHIKRGTTYQVVGRGKLQTDAPLTDYAEVVAYRCEETGDVWVRPQSEFTPDRFRALPAAPVAEAQPTIGGAELDALVARLRKAESRLSFQSRYMDDARAVSDAITALRANDKENYRQDVSSAPPPSDLARPDWANEDRTHRWAGCDARGLSDHDWRAMAERLGVILRDCDGALKALDIPSDAEPRSIARAALSDLAKMKGE